MTNRDMKYFTETITLATTSPLEFVDITDRVRAAFGRSGVTRGIVQVFSAHTTAAIRVNERCERLQRDMVKRLRDFAPSGNGYEHDADTVDGRANAHSHLMSLALGASESIPVAGGRLQLGEWQSVFFIELDGPRDARSATVTIVGE
jgi:secondary thiamine-phosphate synthase enzyme